jgi:hypothetical protein
VSADRVLVLVAGVLLILAVNWWFLGEELGSRLRGERHSRARLGGRTDGH